METKATDSKGQAKGRARGLGAIYLRGNTYWIVYHHNGQRIRESSHSIKESDAVRLLKRRYAAARP